LKSKKRHFLKLTVTKLAILPTTNEHDHTNRSCRWCLIATTIIIPVTITTMTYSTPTIIILYALFTLVALSFQESCLVLAKKGDGDDNKGDDKVTQKQATTTVANVDANDVSLEEIDFFDQVWLTAFNTVYMNGNLTATAVQMEGKKMRTGDRRELRGYFNYFDFYILIDFRCRFCPGYRRTLKPNSSNKKKRAPVQALHHAFERTLCDILREGPYDVYRDVRQCQVTFADN
jgi:hypothetical protein